MSEPSKAFVSVVSPIYNTEPYLEECIRSVLTQTHSNFEYILIDNYSTDRSSEIAADFALRDSRIRVIRPPTFLKQVDNFNFGLRQISPHSQYTKLVLSDDWLFPNCLASMAALADDNPRVGLVSSYRLVETRGGGFGLPVHRTVLPGRDACRLHLLDGIFLFGSQTAVMYRSDIVRSSSEFYRTDRIHFDTDVAFTLLHRHDFGFVHQLLSFCRERSDSVSGSTRDFGLKALDRMVLVKNHGRNFLSDEEYRHCHEGAERFFYDGLAREWLARPTGYPKSSFWTFQNKGLATAGESIKPARLARAVARVIAKTAASPLEIAKSLRDSHSGG
jgi:glycosyltransferase involved in cell wall biosynthesis